MINDKVTVIIPTLNEENFVSRCLESILCQSFDIKKLDIIVIDGGSLDKTCDIVDLYHKKYCNITLLHNPKRIQAAAFNLGIEYSDSPIIIRLDAHALYDKDYIKLCVEHISTLKYGNVGGRWIMKPQNSSIMAQANAILNGMRFAIGGASYRVSDNTTEVETVPFGCYLRDVITKVGPINEMLFRGEDNEYNYRIRKAGYKILFDPKIKCDYFARPTYKTSVKQMYANGFSIGVLLHQCRKSINIRHLIPFLFLLSIVVLGIASFVTKFALYLLLVELGLYAILDIVSSILNSLGKSWKMYFILPFLVFSVHMAYGLGIFIGIIKRKY